MGPLHKALNREQLHNSKCQIWNHHSFTMSASRVRCKLVFPILKWEVLVINIDLFQLSMILQSHIVSNCRKRLKEGYPIWCHDEKYHANVNTQWFWSIIWRSALQDLQEASFFFSHTQSCPLQGRALKWWDSVLQFQKFRKVTLFLDDRFLSTRLPHCQLLPCYYFYLRSVTFCS